MDGQEPEGLEADRSCRGIDDDRVERELLGPVGLLASLGPPVDSEGSTVDANGGAEAVE